MLNVRLDDDTESKLLKYAEDHEMSKSSVVSEALSVYLSKKDLDQSPFALGEDLFGADASNQTNSSQSYKSKLKHKLNEKHTH